MYTIMFPEQNNIGLIKENNAFVRANSYEKH